MTELVELERNHDSYISGLLLQELSPSVFGHWVELID